LVEQFAIGQILAREGLKGGKLKRGKRKLPFAIEKQHASELYSQTPKLG